MFLQFCIIADRDNLVGIAIVSKAIVPDVALVDPQTTLTMDPYLTACTEWMLSFMQLKLTFVSLGHGALTDSYALEAIKLIQQNLANCSKIRLISN